MRFRLPPREGLIACRTVLRATSPCALIDALCARYPTIARAEWESRFAQRWIFDASGNVLEAECVAAGSFEVHYYRAFREDVLPVQEQVLFADEHLLVADKPHFLPVIPAGKYREQTLVMRLIRSTGNDELSPLHRIDRATAGLVLFSTRRETRAIYQALFRERRIEKRYEALAPTMPDQQIPLRRRSRLERDPDGFRTREVDGEPNSETGIEVIERGGSTWRYALSPHTGRMHQLRVHMAALGAPILGDTWYPTAQPQGPDDYAHPLQLLARALRFDDPLSGKPREFVSTHRLAALSEHGVDHV